MATKKQNQTNSEPQQGGYNDFTLVSRFPLGYRNREDITVLPPGILVQGSQNVLTNTFQRVGIRKGYTLDGQSNSALAPIGGQNGAMGVFDWTTSQGDERNMRAGFLTSAGNDGKLQFRNVLADDTVEWTDLLTDLTSVDFNYCTFWVPEAEQVWLLMVNGESNIRSWSGITTTVVSATNTAGIIVSVDQPGDLSQILVSGGFGYTVGDVLTVTGGGGNATLTVDAVATGAISVAAVNAGGSSWAVNDEFTIAGGTGGQFTAIGKVTGVSGGAVTTFTLLGNGTGYSTTTGVVCTRLSGTGAGLTIDITVVSGGAISDWVFISDADHGTGYANTTTYTLTGGTGSNAHIHTNVIGSGTIVKGGTQTWAEAGFIFGDGNFQDPVTINGTTYEYYSDAFIGDTTTLYGITPDPSAIPAGSVIVDAVRTWANTGGSDGIPDDFANQLIVSWEGRVLVGALDSSAVYLSEFTSFTTWDVAATIILNNNVTSFVVQQDAVYISTGKNDWFQVTIALSSDLSTRRLVVASLNVAAQQGAQSQAATTKIANSVAFLSFEPIIQSFGPVQNILLGPQFTDTSFSVVNLMNSLDLTNASLFYYRKYVYVSVPQEGLVLVYNMTDPNNPYWEAPQRMPIARFSIINGDLYGHSSQVSETYKLFDGTNDNGHPITAAAVFSFNSYGTRSQSKGYNEFYAEGYISANTTLTLGIQYDIDGCATQTAYDIAGDDTQIVCIGTAADNSLGKFPLGMQPLGSAITPADLNNPNPKFRVVKTFPTRYFYEDQISFSSTGTDYQWEIVAFGPQLQPYTDLNNHITQ